MRRLLAILFSVSAILACGSPWHPGKNLDALADRAAPDGASQPETVPEVTDAAVPEVGDGSAHEALAEIDAGPPFPPVELPFAFSRPQSGTPIPDEEIKEFTRQVTGLWKKTDWFRWLLRTSTGMDPSSGMEEYLAWYNDVIAVKEGGKVTFKQKGGDHNMWIPGSKILSQAVNGCALTGDWTVCKVAEQYCKGLTASVKGFVWDEADPAPFLMARAIFPHDHSFVLDGETWQDDGREKAVEFHDMYHEEDGWNAQTFAWPHNPTWGSIWVTNMRSKDDVCAIVRTTTFLPLVIADAPYEWVREACQETMDTMVGFNRDIVDSGYNIRTKDPEGNAYIIEDQDLGNYVWYAGFDEYCECPARLATDLIAYQEPLTNDCGSGFGSLYDQIAPRGHYYNYPIIWNYHMAAVGNALLYGYDEIALALLEGLAMRMDAYLAPDSEEPGVTHSSWSRDMAILLVQGAAVGLPLTYDEARLVHKHWSQAVVELEEWPRWDLWAPEVPDGQYDAGSGFRPPNTPGGISRDAVAMFLEYCNSPFGNQAGAAFIDCDIVADPSRWGE